MAITKQRKQELVSSFVQLLDKSNGFVIVEASGMTVPQVNELRKKVRGAHGRFLVVKNTLLTKALQQKGWPVPADLLKGPVGIAFGLENFPSVAKAVLEFTSNPELAEKIKLKGGGMNNATLDAARVELVSKLPSLDEMRAQLAGLIVQPATGLVSVLNSATGQLVNVLQAYVREKGGDGEAA